MERYDPQKNKWTTLKPLSKVRSQGAAMHALDLSILLVANHGTRNQSSLLCWMRWKDTILKQADGKTCPHCSSSAPIFLLPTAPVRSDHCRFDGGLVCDKCAS